MITQSNNNSTASATVQNIVANKVGLLDSYILFNTGDNEYTALIKDHATKDIEQIRIYRTNNQSQWQVESRTATEFEYTVNNEYYAFSNLGIGQPLNCPIYQQTTAYATVIMCCIVLFAVLFKGVLFKWLRR